MKTYPVNNKSKSSRVSYVGITFWVVMLFMTCWMSFIQTRSSYPVNAVMGIFVSLSGLANYSRPLVRSGRTKKFLTGLAIVFAIIAVIIAVSNLAKHP